MQYLTSILDELKKVKWPSKQDTKRLTVYVVGVSLIVGLIVSGLDYLFQRGIGLLFN